jgi:alkanesulfonate monooxygenase SsuD/methylene tetrahydromethanopterin reductase-like flavin-dependent oxidoreductase (luciferase family)
MWCAQHRYPYIALATFLEPTVELWDIYRDAAAAEGYQVGPENFGYLQKVYVAETDEKAREIAKWDMFGGAGIGYSLFGQPQWMFPPGYNSKEATRRIARQFTDPHADKKSPWAGLADGTTTSKIADAQVKTRSAVWQDSGPIDVEATRKQIFEAFPAVERAMQVICGTPDTVIPKLRTVLEVLRPGIFAFWQNDGPISKEDRLNNIRLIAKEVMPAVREIGRELGLTSPFEVKPGSRPLKGNRPESVGSLEPLQRLNGQTTAHA